MRIPLTAVEVQRAPLHRDRRVAEAATGWALEVAACLLPLIAFLMPMLVIPMKPDEAAYAMVARGIGEGLLPYRDLFDHKPPLVYAWYVMAFAVFGDNATSPRLASALVLCATSLTVLWVARSFLSPRRALASAAVFGASTGALLLDIDANTEVFATLPAIASLALAVRASERSRWWVGGASGALAAASVLTRPVLIFAVAVLGLWFAWNALRTGRWSPFVAYAGAGLVVAVVVLAPFARAGALDDFWFANVTYQGFYFEALGDERWAFVARRLAHVVLAIAPVLVGAWLGARSLRSRAVPERERLFLAWSLAAGVGVFVTGRVLEHYVVVVLPSLAILSSYVVERPEWRPSWRSPLAAILLLMCAVSLAANLRYFHVLVSTENPGTLRREVGLELGRTTCASATIWELGPGTTPNYYAGRPSPTRYLYDRPFLIGAASFESTYADLVRRPPAVIIDGRLFEEPGASATHVIDTQVGKWFYPAALASLLTSSYELVEVHEPVLAVYRLKESVGRCIDDRALATRP